MLDRYHKITISFFLLPFYTSTVHPSRKQSRSLLLIRIQLLPKSNAQLLSQRVHVLEVLLVLIRALNLGLDTCCRLVSCCVHL